MHNLTYCYVEDSNLGESVVELNVDWNCSDAAQLDLRTSGGERSEGVALRWRCAGLERSAKTSIWYKRIFFGEKKKLLCMINKSVHWKQELCSRIDQTLRNFKMTQTS